MSCCVELKLVGGLGNQLFQYATARSFCAKRKIRFLWLNTDSYAGTDFFGRVFGLHNFKVKGREIKNTRMRRMLRRDSKLNRILGHPPIYKRIDEQGLKLHELDDKGALVTALNGYWQSEFYFKDIRPQLLSELTPRELPNWPQWIGEKDTVSIHIRRTDYLKESGFGALSEKYYQDAIRFFREKLGRPKFVVFSDDLEWCKTVFVGTDFVFCEEPAWEKDYLQLYLMSKCRHQIIANSSFSWWGAWLNDHPDKIVVRPTHPFADDSLLYESYYPAEWTPIDNRG